MHRILLLSLFILLCHSSFSQKKAFHSAYSFGSGIGLDDEVNDAYYQSGYIYTTGYFAGSVDFNPGKDIALYYTGYTNGEREDVYFAKYDSLDNLVWAKQLKGNAVNQGLAIAADKAGNVLVAGEFIGAIDLDPSTNSYVVNSRFQQRNSFLAKYNRNGDFIWGFAFDGGRANAIQDIATDANKNITITGFFRDTMDIEKGSGQTLLKAGYSKQAFLIQYDSTGKLNWGYALGSGSDDEGKSLHIDASNQIYLGGMFTGTVDFDPSSSTNNLTSQGALDVFMNKYTNSGALIRAIRIGGSRDNILGGMAVSNGRMWICGDFERDCDFDPSSNIYFPPIKGEKDLYISCYDTSGSFEWAHSFGANGAYTYGHAVAADDNGNCYIAAFSDDYIDWDPSKSTLGITGRDDAVLASYDSRGRLRWGHKMGGTRVDKPHAVITVGDDVACYGYFDTKAEFGNSGKSKELVSSGSVLSGGRKSGFHARYTNDKGALVNAFCNTDDMGNGDVVYATTHDENGNIYVGGYVSGMADLDHSTSSFKYLNGKGIMQALLVRYDSTMALDYAMEFLSTGPTEIRDVVVDNSSNLYFTGIFEDTLYLSPNRSNKKLIAEGSNDAFFGKIDNMGKLLWVKRIGGSSRTYGNALALDSKGNIIVSGGFSGKTDFDPTSVTHEETSSGSYDAYVAKYSAAGDFKWVVNFGNTEFDFCHDLRIGRNDDIYSSGTFHLNVDFNPNGSAVGRASNGGYDCFVNKIDSNGLLEWVKSFGGKGTDISIGLELDAHENVYATGYFFGSVDFDPSSSTKNLKALGNYDAFLTSFNAEGDFRWAHQYGSSADGSGESGKTILYRNGRIYLGGTFHDTTDFDPSSNTYWLYTPNAFVAIMDTLGNFEEAHSFGSERQPEDVLDLTFSGNNLFVAGYYQDNTDFDPSLSSERILENKRSNDGYLLRLNLPTSCRHSKSTLNISQCGPYTLPSGERTVSVNGTYQDVIRNKEGCDSNITIVYERLNNLVTSTVSTCGSYLSPAGKTYTKSGMYYDTLTNQYNCDSIIITQLQINSSHENAQVETCDSFFMPGNQKWVSQSGMYVDSFTNQLNCDSLIELQITVNQSHEKQQLVSGCNEFTIPSSSRTVYQSGVYTDSFQTQTGCDSTLKWIVSIYSPTSDTVNQVACNEFYLPGKQQLVTQSGLYTDSLMSSHGCDSIIHWNVDMHQSVSSSLSASFCDSFYFSGRQVWAHQSGTYTDSLVSVYGCDSIVNWSLTKTNLHAGFKVFGDSLVADSANYKQYQWFTCGNDTTAIQGANAFYFVANQSGKYALGVEHNACYEFSVCEQIMVVSNHKIHKRDIKLFPNPTTGMVTVQILDGDYQGRLFSVSGKVLIEFNSLNEGQNEIDLSRLSSGSYILSLKSEKGEVYRELIIKD